MIEFTGERVVPGQVEEDLWAEHFSRYAFAARLVSGGRVLDIGCGTGYGTAELARAADATVGLDVSVEAVAYAATHYASPNTLFLAATATALPFTDTSFDVVVIFEVIEHLADWRALLIEARRVVRPSGLVLISTPNKNYYSESRGASGANPFHVHEFEPREFQDALADVFPHTRILLQNRVHAFGFYTPETAAPTDAQIGASQGSADDAHFLLAVCSLHAVPDLRNFIYVPRASNVLRERERHIESLRQELDLGRSERDAVMRSHEVLTRDLEEKTRWARELDEQLAATRSERDAVIRSHELLTRDLQEKIQWASRLTDEIANARQELQQAIRAIDAAENTVIERTRWAQELDAQLQAAQQRLSTLEMSRWVRLGRRLGLGPAGASPERKKDG